MAKPVVFLLPGLLCDEFIWAHQIKGLSDRVEIAAPNFFGFDAIPEMARSVLRAAPERFAVIGHSMGGRVALEIMRQAPERVTHLGLLDTGIHPRRPGEAEKRQVLVDLAYAEGMNALAQAWLPPMVHPDRLNDGPLMTGLTDMVCRATPAIFKGQINALVQRPDAITGLAAIRCPVLLGCGRQDGWSPVAQHEEIAAHISQAKLVVFEHSGHMAPAEAPDSVTRALSDFLR